MFLIEIRDRKGRRRLENKRILKADEFGGPDHAATLESLQKKQEHRGEQERYEEQKRRGQEAIGRVRKPAAIAPRQGAMFMRAMPQGSLCHRHSLT